MWIFRPIELVCFILNGMITQWLKRLWRFKMQTVWMTRSHAMIILWHLCTVHTVFGPCFCGTIRTLCDVQARSSHNANYDCCGSDWPLILWWEPKSQTGRGDTTMRHSCRVWQLSTERRWRLWFKFIQSCADIYLFVLLWALRTTLCCFYLSCERIILLRNV